jgi:hypothetical protein
MRVRVGDRSQLGSLIDYLRRCECSVGFTDGDLDVHPRQLPVDSRLRYEALELAALLRVWSVFHPEADVELVASEDAGIRRSGVAESRLRRLFDH